MNKNMQQRKHKTSKIERSLRQEARSRHTHNVSKGNLFSLMADFDGEVLIKELPTRALECQETIPTMGKKAQQCDGDERNNNEKTERSKRSVKTYTHSDNTVHALLNGKTPPGLDNCSSAEVSSTMRQTFAVLLLPEGMGGF
ncbi:hypothetical protein TNCT_427661 [Trichonephila clavata]|uniref:Uncharacterized protein n=1 Tax=Trichonephila clavata TaxID=2740835 RepID=A0A8X6G2Q1_TRICU|nr:hypothetical protein TNCT_427661 [Trichonephila clavata]